MASQRDNELLMQTTKGTPMGELLRRYWHPIAAVGELDEQPTKSVRLMGEDLVLYKDRSGTLGLLELHCAHRRADLSYGIVEGGGLRCNYHGWLYDETGQCIAQPFDDLAYPESQFKDRIKLQAYPVEEKGGLVWAYLGPQPAPLVPDWEAFSWDDVLVQLVFTEVPCNWLQGQENSIDPVHVEWLHGYWSWAQSDQKRPLTQGHHIKIGFDEWEYGYQYRRLTDAPTDHGEQWRTGRTCLWPNAFVLATHFEWRVPIDDGHMLSVGWFFDAPAPGFEYPADRHIYHWNAPLTDASTGRWMSLDVMNQDYTAWVGQGQTADRTREHLSPSDQGIVMLRQRLLEQMKAVERGEDPWGVIRDPARNYRIQIPNMHRNATEGFGAGAGPASPGYRFRFLSGQPPEVAEAFRKVKSTWGDPVTPGSPIGAGRG
jgi:5,5'-dehydrodivanillate O-demethylase oxygenase subunit